MLLDPEVEAGSELGGTSNLTPVAHSVRVILYHSVVRWRSNPFLS
jgi:hypothetical protein